METLGASAPSFTNLQMHDERPEETCAAPSSSKRRKLASKVWNDFDKSIKDGKEKAVCKHCNREFEGSSKNGTTHLKNHLSSCPNLKDGETHKKITSTRLETAGVDGDFVFDEERSRLDLTRMIIKNRCPLDLVESESFQTLVKNLQPKFKFNSQDTLKAYILHVYKEEKEKLKKYLGTLSYHFNLIIQFWICHQKNVYCCFALQFLEHGMILKKKIIAFKKVDQDDDIAAGTLFGRVTSLLQEWNIDQKLCSITLRSSHPNDKMVQKLGTWLCKQACQLPLCGNFFHIYCIKDILNLLFQNGWNEVGGVLGKIRNAARYINEDRQHWEQNFDKILEQHHFQDKNSVSIRWDSALDLLTRALNLEKQISCLKTKDRDFVAPSMDEWDAVATVFKFLKLLDDDACHLSGCKYLTANMYFPHICGIQFKLLELEKSKDENICAMATKMKIPFDKYFDKCRTVLAIACILDPSRNLEYMTFVVEKFYGSMEVETYLAPIMNALNSIFDYYEKEFGKRVSSSSVATNNGNSFTSYCDVSQYDELNRSWREETYHGNKVVSRKELDQYLKEPCIGVNGEFDILNWWRTNSTFPTLRTMALDILKIPMSTDSDFRIGNMTKIIDPAFNGLHSDIIEAMICGKEWLDMSTNKAPTKEDEHFSSYTLNGEPTDHDHTSIAMGDELHSFGTNMDLGLTIGHQDDPLSHCTPITSHFPTSQVPVHQEPNSQPLADCMRTRTNINPTVTVPQETKSNLGIELGQLHSHCTPSTHLSHTSQVPVTQDLLPSPHSMPSTNKDLFESSSSGNLARTNWDFCLEFDFGR